MRGQEIDTVRIFHGGILLNDWIVIRDPIIR